MPVRCRSGSGPLELAQGSCPKIFPGERTALGRPSLRERKARELGQHLFPRLRLSLRNGGFATAGALQHIESRSLSANTTNQPLAAVRSLAHQAADSVC